jgi:Domain of unknown function (DUF4136)
MSTNPLRFAFAKIEIFVSVICLAGFTASVSAQQVKTDYDKSKDFHRYHSYYWQRVTTPSQAWDERVKKAVDTELEKKGWRKQVAGGDVAVIGIGIAGNANDLSAFYVGTPWLWRGPGSAATSASGPGYRRGTLVVDMYDSNSHQLLWRGAVTDILSGVPEKHEEELAHAVDQLFSSFPPQ